MRKTISISLQEELLQKAKEKATELDIGYQTLIQNILRYHLFNEGGEDSLSLETLFIKVIKKIVREEIREMLISPKEIPETSIKK